MQDNKETSMEEEAKKENFPPAGTYPSPNVKVPLLPKEPPKRTRRVGTVTMALFLILIGILMLVSVFVPTLNLVFVARLSPVIFVLLGIEILLVSIFDKENTIKYDFASIILCFFLIGGTLLAGVVPLVLQRSWQEDEIYRFKHSQLKDKSADLLLQNDMILSLDWHVGVYNTNTFFENSLFFDRSEETTEKLADKMSYAGASITLAKNYETKEAFFEDSQRVISQLREIEPKLEWVQIYSKDYEKMTNGINHFSLDLNQPYSIPLQKYNYYLSAWYYDANDNTFYSKEEWEQRENSGDVYTEGANYVSEPEVAESFPANESEPVAAAG